jgi:photosystem II stability/assembly factor-like uncharacterized protein
MVRLLSVYFLLSCIQLSAQQLTLVNKEYKTSLRGLSVVDDNVIWVSGSNGIVGRSTDKGQSWQWITVPGMEKREFRDVEAFDANTAVIMAVAEPAIILRTTDAGKTWKTQFTDERPGMFLDAMDFHGNDGYVIGDPIDGKMFLAGTSDAGNTWQVIQQPELPVQQGEACFASSGTNIITQPGGSFLLLTGGTASRLLTHGTAKTTPLIQGKESTGGNSIAEFRNHHKGKNLLFIAGGDFAAPQSSEKNLFYSIDNGTTWIQPVQPPKGYKSCVTFITATCLVSCGTSGVDVSYDSGKKWQHISDESYHVVQKAKSGKLIVLAGGNGKIGLLKL